MAQIVNSKPIVGVIGLGIMGSSFASNLLSKGYEVHGSNRTARKAERLVAKDAKFRPTPGELAQVVDVALTLYLGYAGCGHKMELVVNLYLGLVAESFSEALVFTRK